MADADLALEFGNFGIVEYFIDEAHIFIGRDNSVVGYRHAAAFLTAMLECKKSVVHFFGKIQLIVAENPHDAAGFFDF